LKSLFVSCQRNGSLAERRFLKAAPSLHEHLHARRAGPRAPRRLRVRRNIAPSSNLTLSLPRRPFRASCAIPHQRRPSWNSRETRQALACARRCGRSLPALGAYAVDFYGQPRTTRHTGRLARRRAPTTWNAPTGVDQLGAPAIAVEHLSAASPLEVVWIGVPPDRHRSCQRYARPPLWPTRGRAG